MGGGLRGIMKNISWLYIRMKEKIVGFFLCVRDFILRVYKLCFVRYLGRVMGFVAALVTLYQFLWQPNTIDVEDSRPPEQLIPKQNISKLEHKIPTSNNKEPQAYSELEKADQEIIRNLGQVLECYSSGCAFHGEYLCDYNVEKVKLLDKSNGNSQEIEIEKCENYKYPNEKCLSIPDNLFPINHESQVVIVLDLPSGRKYESDPVKIRYVFENDNTRRYDIYDKYFWVELPPVGKFKDKAPLLTARLESQFSNLMFYLSAEKCPTLQTPKIEYVEYDFDGKGFIRPKYNKRQKFAAEVPSSDKISIRYRVNGILKGPYQYAFNKNTLSSTPAKHAGLPSIVCGKTYLSQDGITPFAECFPDPDDSLLQWLNVLKVKTGCTQEVNEWVNSVNVTSDTILHNFKMVPQKMKVRELFSISVPENCSDFYYEIIYKDGSTTEVSRVASSQWKNIRSYRRR